MIKMEFLHTEPIPFYRNKTYIALITVLLFVVGGFFVTKGMIGLDRRKDTEPVQPIYYSHKVHAGTNQINCLYCHGGAMEISTTAVPSMWPPPMAFQTSSNLEGDAVVCFRRRR